MAPTEMLCTFCSLLCDDVALQNACPKYHRIQTHSLPTVANRNNVSLPARDVADPLTTARHWIEQSDAILVSGRVACVESSRAALRFAHATNASIDFSPDGSAMEYAQAVARSGAWTSSIAESRDLSDLFIVLNEELLERFPMLPQSLSKKEFETAQSNAHRTVLLVGKWSRDSVQRWRDAFDDVWTVDCPIDQLPQSLLQGVRIRQDHSSSSKSDPADSSTSHLMRKLREATYTTVVWSSSCLKVQSIQLWVEELQHWLHSINESTRGSSLHLAGSTGTFAQVCLWTTGYPGRVRFQDAEAIYDPIDGSYKRWIVKNAANPNALLIWVDEAPWDPADDRSGVFDPPANAACRMIQLIGDSRNGLHTLLASDRSMDFAIPIAGVSSDGDFFRADQVVLAKAQARIAPSSGAYRLADWFKQVTS